MLRKFCLGNNFLMNIKENTDFLLQRPRQLASAKMIFKDRRNVFCNVNLSNLGNLLQRNVRTGRVRKCIFRASGDKFCKFFPSAPIMAAPLWAPCPCIYQSAQKNLDVLLYVYNIYLYGHLFIKKIFMTTIIECQPETCYPYHKLFIKNEECIYKIMAMQLLP